MSIESEKKILVITEYGSSKNDTGSPEVQVALLSARVRQLTDHLRKHSKDFAARRGLLVLVGRRSRILKYLNSVDRARYLDVIQKLGIRAK